MESVPEQALPKSNVRVSLLVPVSLFTHGKPGKQQLIYLLTVLKSYKLLSIWPFS
jgi:hypothetical protein